MTVHARGYRRYRGGFARGLPALAIAKEGLRIALTRKAFRRIGVLYLLWFSMCAFFLYIAVGTDLGTFMEMFGKAVDGGVAKPGSYVLEALDRVLFAFYTGVALLTALLAIFVGSGVISDDLATGALPLYLVRPIRAMDYVLGKGLILPGILLVAILLPGVLFYLIVGLWQPPGESWPFLRANLDVLARVIEHYAVAAAAYTGLTLFVSSRSPRRAAVAVLAAVAIFGGILLRHLASEGVVGGRLASLFLVLDLPRDTVTTFLWRLRAYDPPIRWEVIASRATIAGVALVLLVVGVHAAWRRARSVEVTA